MKTFLQKIEPVLLERILLIILSGSFLTFSLYVYQAYNIEGGYSYSGHSLLFRAICFGVLTSISFSLNEYLLHKVIPVKYIISWRIWELLMGGTVTFLLFNYFWNWQEWFYYSYFQLLLEYSAIIIFPILISHFIKKYVIQLQYIQKEKDEYSQIETNQKKLLGFTAYAVPFTNIRACPFFVFVFLVYNKYISIYIYKWHACPGSYKEVYTIGK